MQITLVTLAALLAPALAAPAQLQAREAWFPDVWSCRCTNAASGESIVQPICGKIQGQDMTLDPPHPTLGRNVWCNKTSLKTAQRENRMAGDFTNAACAQFGAGFVAECKVFAYSYCEGEGPECYQCCEIYLYIS